MISHGLVVNTIVPESTATQMLEKRKTIVFRISYTTSQFYAMSEELVLLALFMVSGVGNMIVTIWFI